MRDISPSVGGIMTPCSLFSSRMLGNDDAVDIKALCHFPFEKYRIVGADPRVRPLGAHTWVRPYNTVFGFQFSVKRIKIINKLRRKFVSFASESGIKKRY